MTKFLGLFIVMFVGVVIVFLIFKIQTHHLREINRCYARLARRFRGELLPAALFDTPRVHFTYQGAAALVDIQVAPGGARNCYTQFQIHWPDPHFRCEVYPDPQRSGARKFPGMHDLQIGSPDFDRDYVITSNDDETVRLLLSADVQNKINALRALEGSRQIFMSISGGRLQVKKLGYLRREAVLQQFVQLSLDLFDLAMVATAKGIEFVQQQSPPEIDQAMCQICGDAVRERVVLCRRCKTPHHLDCWLYYGACSTYGCRETRYTAADQ